ncbi:MAG: formylglycine-generating enzyme family protein [Prevotellaceae bacterium]|jgi:formylglycine-generating enzyme required for sulfatase activity|nr:formylglycine-generating enzyme family protein [Prevotellaceae bacterium]
MKQNYKISLCALLLVGATGMMTAGAQGSGKPTLAVFVVGMDNTLGDALATQIGSELNRNSRYTVLSGAADPVKAKLTELRTQGARNIDRNALAAWGLDNGISAICLVADDIKGNDHMFYAHLIDAKNSKVSGRGSYIRTGVTTTDLPRVSLALSRQLDWPGRRRSAPTPARSYPAELDIEMVFVEGGTFTMGCVPARDGACNSAELPAHSVTLSSFYIGKYEVTQAQWRAVMGSNHSYSQTDDQLPMEMVAYDDAAGTNGFLVQLNALTGKNYRLPTEAEWEYVARGGKHQSPYTYSGSNNIEEVVWYLGNSGSRTHPVGQKNPNALGIYDMQGNVWEWCSDWYGAYSSAAQTNPTGPGTGTYRALRGVSYSNPVNEIRLAGRNPYGAPTGDRRTFRGLRVVLPAQ